MFVDVLGAGREVGRSCVIVTWVGKATAAACGFGRQMPDVVSDQLVRVMFDCGYHVSDKLNRLPDFRRWLGVTDHTSDEEVGVALSERINVVLITHFHLDHIGGLPHLVSQLKCTIPIYASLPTKGLGEFVMYDLFKGNESGHAAVMNALRAIRPFPEGGRIKLRGSNGSHIAVSSHHAGHVLGSLMFDVTYKGRRVVYTGDLNINAEPLIPNLSFHRNNSMVDLVISECTYGCSEKGSHESSYRDLLSSINERGYSGKILIPCLAVGRAQALSSIIVRGLNPRPRLMLAGYAAANAHSMVQLCAGNTQNGPESLSDISELELINDDDPWWTNSEPGVLFSSPAMLSGGGSSRAFALFCENEDNTVIFTGACVPGSLGKEVLDGAKMVTIDSKRLSVKCKVRYCALATHAGGVGLRAVLAEMSPSHVVLVHGEESSALALAAELEHIAGLKCHVPANWTTTSLQLEDKFDDAALWMFESARVTRFTINDKFMSPVDRRFKPVASKRQLSFYDRLRYPPIFPDLEAWLKKLLLPSHVDSEEGEIDDNSKKISCPNSNIFIELKKEFVRGIIASDFLVPENKEILMVFTSEERSKLRTVSSDMELEFPPSRNTEVLNRGVTECIGMLKIDQSRDFLNRLKSIPLGMLLRHGCSFHENSSGYVLHISRIELSIAFLSSHSGPIDFVTYSSAGVNVSSYSSLAYDPESAKAGGFGCFFIQSCSTSLKEDFMRGEILPGTPMAEVFKNLACHVRTDTEAYRGISVATLKPSPYAGYGVLPPGAYSAAASYYAGYPAHDTLSAQQYHSSNAAHAHAQVPVAGNFSNMVPLASSQAVAGASRTKPVYRGSSFMPEAPSSACTPPGPSSFISGQPPVPCTSYCYPQEPTHHQNFGQEAYKSHHTNPQKSEYLANHPFSGYQSYGCRTMPNGNQNLPETTSMLPSNTYRGTGYESTTYSDYIPSQYHGSWHSAHSLVNPAEKKPSQAAMNSNYRDSGNPSDVVYQFTPTTSSYGPAAGQESYYGDLKNMNQASAHDHPDMANLKYTTWNAMFEKN